MTEYDDNILVQYHDKELMLVPYYYAQDERRGAVVKKPIPNPKTTRLEATVLGYVLIGRKGDESDTTIDPQKLRESARPINGIVEQDRVNRVLTRIFETSTKIIFIEDGKVTPKLEKLM